MTLRVIRVFTAAFPDRAFGKSGSYRSGSAGISHSHKISLLRLKKRLKRRAVAQRRRSDWHCLEEVRLRRRHFAPTSLLGTTLRRERGSGGRCLAGSGRWHTSSGAVARLGGLEDQRQATLCNLCRWNSHVLSRWVTCEHFKYTRWPQPI